MTPGTYAANVAVQFPASLVVNAERLAAGARERGFSSVRVTEDPPSGWPLPTDADYYVLAVWASPTKDFDRPPQLTAVKKVA